MLLKFDTIILFLAYFFSFINSFNTVANNVLLSKNGFKPNNHFLFMHRYWGIFLLTLIVVSKESSLKHNLGMRKR